MTQVDLMEKMRRGTRAALEKADAAAPGFKQSYWDAAQRGTRFGLRAAHNFRGLVPDQLRDAKLGQRIGLLTRLPMQSDLVVQSQPKIGIGGGPDAFQTVRELEGGKGAVIVGLRETDTDITAWQLAHLDKNMLDGKNYPAQGALTYGRGPMHASEIERI